MNSILCIHGVGGKDATLPSWSMEWKSLIREKSSMPLRFVFLKMDDLFRESRHRMSGVQYLQAVRLLLSSWLSSAREKRFRNEAFLDAVRLYAGMPAQYITDELLRIHLRIRLENALRQFRPCILFAHSLGSLVAYDALHLYKEASTISLVTAGSQLGHPALHDLYGGPLNMLPVRLWVNLHNKNDKLFASRGLPVSSPRFIEVETPFEHGPLSHDALYYLRHWDRAWTCIDQMDAEKKRKVTKTHLSVLQHSQFGTF